MLARTYIKVIFWLWEFQLFKKYFVHLIAVMLASVKYIIVYYLFFTLPYYWAHFYNLRPGAENNYNFHTLPQPYWGNFFPKLC